MKDDGGIVELIVVGKVDPEQLRAKVEEKTKSKVDLISVSPAGDICDKCREESSGGSSKAMTVVLRTSLHCKSCVHKCEKVVRIHEGI